MALVVQPSVQSPLRSDQPDDSGWRARVQAPGLEMSGVGPALSNRGHRMVTAGNETLWRYEGSSSR